MGQTNGLNINIGEQFFDNSWKMDLGLRKSNRKDMKKPLTKELLKVKVDAVEALILSDSMYFVVCKYMMWEKLCSEDDFQAAIDILEDLYPGLGLHYSNMTGLNKGSFRGTLEEWDFDDCPFKKRKTFDLYFALAFALKNV